MLKDKIKKKSIKKWPKKQLELTYQTHNIGHKTRWLHEN
jgi:hypothetical protein